MRHKLLLLNLLLAAATGAAGWRLRQDWLRDHQHAATVINRTVKPAPAPAITPVTPPAPFAAPTFADVAQKDLFSKDRNPNIIVEPVAVKPAPKWPSFPICSGVMGLPGGMVAMLAEKPGARSQGVSAGDKIGDLKVVALSAEKITFEFEGQTQEKKIRDLVDHGGHAEVAEAPAAAIASMNPANVAQRGGPPAAAKPGSDVGLGGQAKACDPRDPSPAGTETDGFRKVVNVTPFGAQCSWVAK